MAPVTKPQIQVEARALTRTQRRNMKHRSKAANNPSKLRWKLTKQLNRLMKLAATEKDLLIKIATATKVADVNGFQTDLEDARRDCRMVSAHVQQLKIQQEEPSAYVHTPMGAKGAVALPKIPLLSAEEQQAIDVALCCPEWKHAILSKDELVRLKEYFPNTNPISEYWLNTAIVAEYLRLIGSGAPDTYIIDPFLGAKIVAGSLQPSPALKKKKLLSFKKLAFPVCSNNHWTLATWEPSSKTLSYYDSLNSPGAAALRPFKLFLNQRQVEEDQPRTILYDLKENCDVLPPALKQENAVDCGVYVCLATRAFIQGFPFTFSQPQMNQLRKCIQYELCSGNLLPFF